jgi:hypothetical protein
LLITPLTAGAVPGGLSSLLKLLGSFACEAAHISDGKFAPDLQAFFLFLNLKGCISVMDT